ncbi:MAG: DNA polymerase IV [Nitrospira sp.]|nr:DNA polymerase IV [Nitrospira sp.]MBH0186998.1 DNA polymerase IV [Nitrospira sp.]
MRWPRQILFGDVDAMFTSAAVVKDPSLAGKPIAVGSPPPRGIIAAASYAVRPFGVRSAMPTAKALQLCPQLILLPPDRPLYRRLHDAMHVVTGRLFPLTEWSSIDEFYADTTDLQSLHPDPSALAQLVKHELHAATGLCCTIAVATSKTVAKIAADSHKPDGLAVIEPGTEQSFLALRPPRALPGIGPKTAARLDALGLKTIGDLLDVRWEVPLHRLFGHSLAWIRELAQGLDREPVVADRDSKSISHETTFERDTQDRALLERTLRGFLRELAQNLRQEGLAACGCAVKLKDSHFTITTKHGRFPHPLNYDPDMWPVVQHALRDVMTPGTAYRLAGLALTALTPAVPGLFDQRRAKAIEAMDALVARHGPSVIGLGGVTPNDE